MSAMVATLPTVPQSVQAEQGALGGLLLDPSALSKVSDWLAPEDFYRRDHAEIYRTILALAERGAEFDALVVADALVDAGHSEMVAGGSYVIQLANATPSAANVAAYAEIVVDRSRRRRLIDVGHGIATTAQANGQDTRELVAQAQRDVMALGSATTTGAKTMADVGNRWLRVLEERYQSGALPGLLTPWGKLNRKLGGLCGGNLYVLAARPSMGKSAVAVNIATAASLAGQRTLFFNLEMTDVSIYNRCIASLVDVPLNWLRNPADGDGDYWSHVTEGVKRMRNAKLMIDDSAGLDIGAITARSLREHLRDPLKLIIIDHLHLVPLPGKTRETVEIGHITAGLKKLAKDTGAAVLLLSQLNRSLESRANKRPTMADLRESGNIEQDADAVVLLYRDDYYAERETPPRQTNGFLEMDIAKQREGEIGKVFTKFIPHFSRIDDYEGDDPTYTQTTTNQRGMG